MNIEALYRPFEIVYKTLDECPKTDHKHLFFELVYIVAGSGKQCINENTFAYKPGHLFLITPDDCHSFQIEETTEFFFLRFNNIYIKSKGFQAEDIKMLEYILQNASHQPGCILKNLSDKPLFKSLVEATISESVNRDIYNQDLIKQIVNTMIVLVARNIAKYLPMATSEATDKKALDILHYIQENICLPERLRVKYLSEHFGISKSYFGRYFKKITQQTYQEYVNQLRIKHVKARLQLSNLRINEIVDELGFTDVSHLNRFFKRYEKVSPTEFRKLDVKNETNSHQLGI
ncbi:AraC family transcriptional regulator [Tunicatimonas pelagia]|uniref:AraC family transcriptional regulator n=1 Tax=Tunicatimonas pelagia TaxID=931531 RepID=UPI002665A586|nr:AraC family transcriptional regulator [Tunicatimonas pelagia]WKN42769.1 AraC family transcriptional regulator [Tunicatimonas pelagia]